MKLVSDWRHVVKRAWSVRLNGLSILLLGAEAAVPYLQDVIPVSPGTFAFLSFLTTIASGIARLLAQSTMPDEEPS